MFIDHEPNVHHMKAVAAGAYRSKARRNLNEAIMYEEASKTPGDMCSVQSELHLEQAIRDESTAVELEEFLRTETSNKQTAT